MNDSACPACDAARQDPIGSALYHSDCVSCAARALAHSPAFYDTIQNHALSDECRAAVINHAEHCRVTPEAMFKMAKDWWRRIAVRKIEAGL